MSKLYSIYDSGADVYVFFGEYDHDRTAIQHFYERCFYLPRTGSDMFLCVIGCYNSTTGEVDALSSPKRIARGFTVCEGKEQELFPSPSTSDLSSVSKDSSQIKTHINLRRSRGFYAVLFILLLAACAIAYCCGGCNFINVEEIKNGSLL